MDDTLLRACREISANLEARYDREAVRDCLRESLRQNIEKRNAESGEKASRAVIDEEVSLGSAEIEEVVWEGLVGALEMGIKALMMTAASVYLVPVARQINAAESKVREQMDAKSHVRDAIVEALLDPWLERFASRFSRAGRPPSDLDDWELDRERERFIQELTKAVKRLKTVNKGNIGLELGFGKSREGLEPSSATAAKALREKAARLGVNVDTLIRNHRAGKK